MKINIQNTDQIERAIAAVEGKARARCMSPRRIVDIAERLEARLEELCIPKRHRKGATGTGWADVWIGEAPVGITWGYDTTWVELKRFSSGWFLIAADRRKIYRDTELSEKLYIPKVMFELGIPNLLRQRRVSVFSTANEA